MKCETTARREDTNLYAKYELETSFATGPHGEELWRAVITDLSGEPQKRIASEGEGLREGEAIWSAVTAHLRAVAASG